jgi:hypothetical protein
MTGQMQYQVGKIRIELEDAPELKFPGDRTGGTDCNSPGWWSDGKFFVLNSTGHPWRSSGADVTQMGPSTAIVYSTFRDGGRWIESVHQEVDGTLFGWYHNEPANFIPEEVQKGKPNRLTAPMIGALVSHDNGTTWDDLGIVLAGGPDTNNYDTPNFFFAGGNGDFSVILDRQGEYFYFLMGTYYKDVTQQGIALARMRHTDLEGPVGKVMKWYNGDWQEPGLCGNVTPNIPVRSDWYNPQPDTMWGPSVHWNTHIQQYVILMNRATDPRWKQEGIYISFTPDISDPNSWTEPLRILETPGWYPQVIGCDTSKHETEREAGQLSRLFIHGKSNYFLKLSMAE